MGEQDCARAAHALRENEQKELWVYVLKDLVRTICATQAERCA